MSLDVSLQKPQTLQAQDNAKNRFPDIQLANHMFTFWHMDLQQRSITFDAFLYTGESTTISPHFYRSAGKIPKGKDMCQVQW